MSYTVVLIRHGESEWNLKNLFTGWSDPDLSETGHKEAIAGGQLLKKEGFTFDLAYTSYLKRAIHTLNHVLQEMDLEWIPVVKSWPLWRPAGPQQVGDRRKVWRGSGEGVASFLRCPAAGPH